VTTGCLWFTFLNHRRGRSGNIVIGILIPRSGQPVRIERRWQRTADNPSKESPTRCAMKAIDNVYGQRLQLAQPQHLREAGGYGAAV